MAVVIITSETTPDQEFLRETVTPVHIESRQSAEQFLQRLCWAIYEEADTDPVERWGADTPQEALQGAAVG